MSVSVGETESKSFENPAYEVGEEAAAAGVMKVTTAPAATNQVDKQELFRILYSRFYATCRSLDVKWLAVLPSGVSGTHR